MRQKLRMLTPGFVMAALMVSGVTQLAARSEQQRDGDVASKSGACNPALTFNTGAGVTAYNICLSSEGNVVNYVAPAGFNHMIGYEGYQICAPGGANYYDAGNSGSSVAPFHWNAAAVNQPNGPGKFPVTITRQTADGLWLLTQKFAMDKKEQDLAITMTLKRLVSPIGAPVYLGRWSDLNTDNDIGDEIVDKSDDSIWHRDGNANPTHHAMVLTALTYGGVGTTRFTSVGGYPYGRGTCGLGAGAVATPAGPGDYAGNVVYNLGGFNTNQAKTVVFNWQRN
jgi:hypothetical protein